MAKKRYYQSPRDRRDERRGMERALHEMPNRYNDQEEQDRSPFPMNRPVREREYMDDHRIREARNEYYAGPGERRRQEMSDAGMIYEDHRAVANFPQEVIMRPYPKPYGYTPEILDDTLRGVDSQMDYDNDHKMKHFYPKKV